MFGALRKISPGFASGMKNLAKSIVDRKLQPKNIADSKMIQRASSMKPQAQRMTTSRKSGR